LSDGTDVKVKIVTELATSDDHAELSWSISPTVFTAANFNILYINDASGSTDDPASDSNGNPIDKYPDDGITDTIFQVDVAAFEALNQQLINDGYGNSDLGIISFAGNARLNLETTPSDQQGVLDALNDPGVVRSGTDYEEAFSDAVTLFFQKQPDVAEASNIVYFLSDGEPWPPYQDFSEEFDKLTSESGGINASVYAFGVGSSVDQTILNSVDNTGSGATIFDDPSDLVAGLSSSQLDIKNVISVTFFVNDVEQNTINDPDFESSVSGITLESLDILGLNPNGANEVRMETLILTDAGEQTITNRIEVPGASVASSTASTEPMVQSLTDSGDFYVIA
ncbi:MAG: vWA domain-containing protein, partial [Geminicoccaceae bacterium]